MINHQPHLDEEKKNAVPSTNINGNINDNTLVFPPFNRSNQEQFHDQKKVTVSINPKKWSQIN